MFSETSKKIIEVHGIVTIVPQVIDLRNSSNSKLLFIVEKHTKPWKKAGQISLPCGIIDVDDKGGAHAVQRELEEETGIDVQTSQIQTLGGFDMLIDVDDKTIIHGIADVYQALVSEQISGILETNAPSEISDVFWCSPSDIIKKYGIQGIRPGTLKAIKIWQDRLKSKPIHIKDGLPKI